MENVEIKFLITALADNQIKDQETRNFVLNRINSDRSLGYDYYVQQRMKSLVAGMKREAAPPLVRKKVLRRIRPVNVFNRSFTYSQIRAIAIAAVIILAIVLYKIFTSK